jgi:hypothetical protein
VCSYVSFKVLKVISVDAANLLAYAKLEKGLYQILKTKMHMLNATSSVLLQTMLLLLNNNLQQTENANDLHTDTDDNSKLYAFMKIKTYCRSNFVNH